MGPTFLFSCFFCPLDAKFDSENLLGVKRGHYKVLQITLSS